MKPATTRSQCSVKSDCRDHLSLWFPQTKTFNHADYELYPVKRLDDQPSWCYKTLTQEVWRRKPVTANSSSERRMKSMNVWWSSQKREVDAAWSLNTRNHSVHGSPTYISSALTPGTRDSLNQATQAIKVTSYWSHQIYSHFSHLHESRRWSALKIVSSFKSIFFNGESK